MMPVNFFNTTKRKLLAISMPLFLAACQPKYESLTSDQVGKVAASELGYPRDIIYTISLSDPREALKCREFRLDSAGYVEIKTPKEIKFAGQNIIRFTKKAEQFLVQSNPNDIYTNIRRIKVCRTSIKAISEVKIFGREATASIIVSQSHVNPLSVLSAEMAANQKVILLDFVQTNQGWALLRKVQ